MPTKQHSSRSSKGKAKVHKVMKEHKQGKLKSGSGKNEVGDANRGFYTPTNGFTLPWLVSGGSGNRLEPG